MRLPPSSRHAVWCVLKIFPPVDLFLETDPPDPFAQDQSVEINACWDTDVGCAIHVFVSTSETSMNEIASSITALWRGEVVRVTTSSLRVRHREGEGVRCGNEVECRLSFRVRRCARSLLVCARNLQKRFGGPTGIEPVTSSMPFKKYQSLTGRNDGNTRLSVSRRGRRWTPRGVFWASGLRADSRTPHLGPAPGCAT
jgi:hypothetical protein